MTNEMRMNKTVNKDMSDQMILSSLLMVSVISDVGRGESPAQDTRLRQQGRPGGDATAVQSMDYTLGRVNHSSSPGNYEIRQSIMSIWATFLQNSFSYLRSNHVCADCFVECSFSSGLR